MKVYVLTSGAYSEYHICYVTLDRTQAEKVVSIHKGMEIEEYDTDGCLIESQNDKPLWEVFSTGEAFEIEQSDSVVNEDGDIEEFLVPKFMMRKNNPYGEFEQTEAKAYNAYVRAKDAAEAKRIAFDRIAEYKARRMEEENDRKRID